MVFCAVVFFFFFFCALNISCHSCFSKGGEEERDHVKLQEFCTLMMFARDSGMR